MKKLLLFLLIFTSITFAGWEVVEDEMHLLSPDGSELMSIYRDIDNQNVVMDWTLGDLLMLGGDVNLTIDNLDTTGTITAGAFTDGFLTITAGDITGMGDITGTDVDIIAGTGDYTSSGLGTFGNIIDSGLSINLGVYTDGSKQLTSTPPTSGILGYWSRTGTVITSAIPLDDLTLTGNLTLPDGGTISALGGLGTDLITLNGTLGEVTVDGDIIANGHLGVSISADDDIGIFYSERNTTDRDVTGLRLSPVLDGSISSGRSIIGGKLDAFITDGTNDQALLCGFSAQVATGGVYSGTVTEICGFKTDMSLLTVNTFTDDWYGYFASSPPPGNPIQKDRITNAYGLFIDDIDTLFTVNSWAIKTGSGKVELGDYLTVPNVRIGDTTAPTYALEVAGVVKSESGRIKNTTRYTTTANILVTDDQVFCNGTFTVTLPTGVDGQTFRIINSGTGTITITSAENILGSIEDVILNAGDVIILTFETTDKWW